MNFESWGKEDAVVKAERKRLENLISNADIRVRADALIEMVDLLQTHGPDNQVIPHLEAALEIYRQLDDKPEVFETLCAIGFEYQSADFHEHAAHLLLDAMAYHQENLLSQPLFELMMRIAHNYSEMENTVDAIYWAERAHEHALEASSAQEAAQAKLHLSRIRQFLGEHSLAASDAQQAYLLVHQGSWPHLVVEALVARLFCELNIQVYSPGDRLDWLVSQSEALLDQMDEPGLAGMLSLMKAWRECLQGRATDATLADIERNLAEAKAKKVVTAATMANFVKAWYFYSVGDAAQAMSVLAKAMIADTEFETRFDHRSALQLKINCLLALGHLEQALEVAYELFAYVELVGPTSRLDELKAQAESIGGKAPVVEHNAPPISCRMTVSPAVETQILKETQMTAIEAIVGDITLLKVDAIVNAARPSLAGGGGVDGAIHAAAGPDLAAAATPLAPCPTGEARVTPGFNLPARLVVHTVGPVWSDGQHGEPELLAACYRNALQLAAEAGARSIAFPAISTGAYGYPIEAATAVAVEAIRDYVAHNPGVLQKVTLIWRSEADAVLAKRLLQAWPE